jgi:hypothetical protein
MTGVAKLRIAKNAALGRQQRLAMPMQSQRSVRHAWDQLDFFYKKGLGYANEMSLRPQTLYGLADSPVGLAGWILDHDIRSYELIARAFDGRPEGLTRDDIVENITLYWLTNTAVSAARSYWDYSATAKKGFFDVKGVTAIRVAVSAKAYPKLIYYNKPSKGGHFAAWEQPKFYSEDVRTGLRPLRKLA